MAVIVLGGSGLVGSRVLEQWSKQQLVVAPRHAELDVLDSAALEAFMRQTDAGVVLNLVAWTDVDAAEAQRGDRDGLAYRLNVQLPAELASLCRERGRHLVHVSTDYVLDGTRADRPYLETDTPHPLGWYAETKWLGEQEVLDSGVSACVARIEMPFSGRGHPKRDFSRTIVERLRAGQTFQGIVDQRITPVFVDDVVQAFRWLVTAKPSGIMHVASSDWTTPFEFASSIAERLRLDTALVQPTEFAAFSKTRPAPRPRHSWLDVSKMQALSGQSIARSVQAELDAWAEQLQSAHSSTG